MHAHAVTTKQGWLAMAWCTFPFLKNFNDSLILPVLPFTMWFFADGLLGFALQ